MGRGLTSIPTESQNWIPLSNPILQAGSHTDTLPWLTFNCIYSAMRFEGCTNQHQGNPVAQTLSLYQVHTTSVLWLHHQVKTTPGAPASSQPHIPQQRQPTNKHCPEGEEMELGAVCRCKANSVKSESRKLLLSQEDREDLATQMWMCTRLERQMLSGSTQNISKPGIL